MMGIGTVEWALILPIVGAFVVAVLGSAFLIAVVAFRRSEQPAGAPGLVPCSQCKALVSTEKGSCPACGARLV